MEKLQHYLLMAIVIGAGSAWSATAPADDHGAHGVEGAVGLVKEVLDSTGRFRDSAVAVAEGYAPFLGCVSGREKGAMGIHFVNGGLVGDGVLNAEQPEILVYEPKKNGQMRLVAVEYLVLAADWDAANPAPPALSGQVFHYTGSPNRYGLPPFYELHVWAWKRNPDGTFGDWNPTVSCDDYAPASP
jgi:hypothetical protein